MRNLTLKAYTWAQARPARELVKAYKKEEGQTVIEYAGIAAFVSIVLILAILTLGQGFVSRAKGLVDGFTGS